MFNIVLEIYILCMYKHTEFVYHMISFCGTHNYVSMYMCSYVYIAGMGDIEEIIIKQSYDNCHDY